MTSFRRINWAGKTAKSFDTTKSSNIIEPGKVPSHKSNKDDDITLNHWGGHKMFGLEPLNIKPPKQHADVQRAYTKKQK
jgi:hypothetical protein